MSFQQHCEEYELYGNHEQEHRDFDMGAASEFQNAFAQSQSENSIRASDSLAKINRLIAAGRFVVAAEYETYCRHTDAITGSIKYAVLDFPSRAEADAYAKAHNDEIEAGDYDATRYFVLPKLPAPEPVRHPQAGETFVNDAGELEDFPF
jgi:hypothetical protein